VYLLKTEGRLDYNDVYIYSSIFYHPIYEHLKEYYGAMDKMLKYQTGKTMKTAHFLYADDEIVNPNTLDRKKNHIMIFDDVMLKDQTQIKKYFCLDRHSNVNKFYLCQSIHAIAKHCIRQNANMFILFHQDSKTLKYFHETHCNGDMDFKEFTLFCDHAWEKKHSFVVTNK